MARERVMSASGPEADVEPDPPSKSTVGNLDDGN